MKFHVFRDVWSMARKFTDSDNYDQFYERIIESSDNPSWAFTLRQAILERDWITEDRPYYNIWPVIIPMIDKFDLDIPAVYLRAPEKPISLRLPEKDNPLSWEGGQVRSIMLADQNGMYKGKIGRPDLCSCLTMMIDVGEVDQTGMPIYTFRIIPLHPGEIVGKIAESLPMHESAEVGVQIPKDIQTNVIKLSCLLGMIADDPQLVTPDVLASDRDKYLNGDDKQREKLRQKARRRGKNCFDVGKQVDYAPGYRRAHFALFWTGKGRKIPKVQLRKHAIVRRERITKLPTGHQSEES